MRYKAFISYKHDAYSRPFAESIEQAIKTYGKPLFSRPMPVFRDEKILQPGQDLPAAIREGLAASEYLIYIASKEAAKAPWIRDEITIWFDQLDRGDKFIIVVIEDQIYMTGEGTNEQIDWERTEILPPILRTRLKGNKLRCDLPWAVKETDRTLDNARFRQEINGLSATLNGLTEPGLMLDKAVLQSRKNRRIRNGAIVTLASLFGLAVVFAVISYLQRQAAIRNKSSAISYLSRSTLAQDPTRAFLIATEALRINPENTEAVTALRSAWYAGPFYNAFTAHANTINDIVFSPAAPTFVTASDDRSIGIWTLSGQAIARISHLPHPILVIAWSHDGRHFATGDNAGAVRLYTAKGELVDSMDHDDKIETLEFSRDDSVLLSASRDYTASAWKLGTRERVPYHHDQRAFSATFSPDGKNVLTAGGDKNAFVWDRKGGLLHTLARHEGPVVNAIYSHRGRYILTTGFDQKVILWDSTGHFIRKFNDARNVVPLVRFSPDDSSFFFTGWGGKLFLYSVADSILKPIDKSTQDILSAEYSPDGRYIAFAGKDAVVHLCSADGVFLTDLRGSGQDINKVTFSPDGRYLLSAGTEGRVFLWDLANLNKDVYSDDKRGVNCIAFAPQTQRILIGDSRGVLSIVDELEKLHYSEKLHRTIIYRIAVSTNERYAATASMDHSAVLIPLQHPADTHRIMHRADVIDVDWSPLNDRFVTAGYDSVACIWDTNGKPLAKPLVHQDRVLAAGWSPDGSYLVTTSDRTAKIWSKDGSLIKSLPHRSRVVNVSFDTKGNRFVTCCRDDSTATVWSSKGDSLFAVHCSGEQNIYQARFSPDGQYLAATTTANEVLVWNTKGELSATLKGHSGFIVDLQFSADSKQILTAAYDYTARLWSIDGSPIQTFSGHTNLVKAARFNPAGTAVITISYDGTLRTWPLMPETIIQRVEKDYPLGIYRLTAGEKRQAGVE